MSEAPDTEDIVQDPGAPEDNQPDAVELEAIAMGWKPQSEFKGPAEKFVSAADYVERGKTIMPFLRRELAGAYKKIESLEKAVGESVKHISRAEQRAYEQARKDLEADLEAAASAGSAADVKAITKEIVDLEKQVVAGARAEPEEPPELTAWKEDNPWFGKDKALTAATIAISEDVLADGYTGKAQVKEVDRRLREAFPDKFAKPTNPNRQLAGAVEGGGSPRRPAGKSFSDMPAEAQAYCDELVRSKVLTREQYVKKYFEESK